MATNFTHPIIEVKDLKKYFPTKRGMLHAVDGINFTIERGKTLGLVGESGCGKSTTGRTILRLIEPTSGEIIFQGQDVNKMNKKGLRHVRKDMQLIFQDPYSSLDPRKTVNQLISEPILANKLFKTKEEVDARVEELMGLVGLAPRLFNTYPHELDGGRRQRIGIARALDVSIQAQILNLLKELQRDLGLSFIFITHDLSVVNHFSDEIAVMYLGKIVEKAPTEELFNNPMHPYTKALLSAIPVSDLRAKKERILIKGEITSPINPPAECRFFKRCNYACDKCKSIPQLNEVKPGHFVACHRLGEF